MAASSSRPRRKRLTREERREQTRRELLDAGFEVIVAHGFEGASIDAITEAAGYTRGAFYSNFSSKEELFVEICEQQLSAFAGEVVPIIRSAPTSDQAAVAARVLTEEAPRPEAMLLLDMARLAATNPEIADQLAGFAERFNAIIATIMADSADELGNPSSDLIREGARTMVAAIVSVVFLGHVGFGDAAIAERLLTGAAMATFGQIAEPTAV